VPLHKVPNLAIGSVHHNHTLRIAFPNMVRQNPNGAFSAVPVPSELVEKFYNEVIRFALIRSVGEACRPHLAANYEHAFIKAQGRHNRITANGVDVQMAAIENFGKLVLRRCDTIEEFKHARFIHEFRGTKGAFRHDPTDPAQCFYALRNFLADLGFSDPSAQYSEDDAINRLNLGLDSPHIDGRVVLMAHITAKTLMTRCARLAL
jgi:hypothetical protein